MRKFIFTGLFLVSCVNAEVYLLPDEKVIQFILIQNNAEKCLQPELWNAENEMERESILAKRSEMDIVIESQYEMALMNELFGYDITVKILENPEYGEQFDRKLYRLSNKNTTVNTAQECEELSRYYFQIKKKHIF